MVNSDFLVATISQIARIVFLNLQCSFLCITGTVVFVYLNTNGGQYNNHCQNNMDSDSEHYSFLKLYLKCIKSKSEKGSRSNNILIPFKTKINVDVPDAFSFASSLLF